MWNDGNYVLWQHIVQLFYQDVENGLKLMPRLTYDHIKLNSYSTMCVNLAAQILSATVAAVMKSFGPPDATLRNSKTVWNDGFLFLIVSMCTAQVSIRGRGNHFSHHIDQWMIQDFFGWQMISLAIWGIERKAPPNTLAISLRMPGAGCSYPGRRTKACRSQPIQL